MPGVSLAQWIGTRFAAIGLSYLSRLWTREKSHGFGEQSILPDMPDLERGESPPAYIAAAKNALGLDGV